MTQRAVPEGKYADIGDGLQIHYHEEGRGPAVVFFHGSGPGGSGWSNYKQNYPYFAARGFRAIVPDLPGYGYSSKPDRDYGMDFMVPAMTRFLDAVGAAKVSLVGNSYGGALAIQMALTHPERVEKLILMAPGGLEDREVYMKMRGLRTMFKVFFGEEGITREGMRKVFELQLFDPKLITPAIIEERYTIAVDQPKRVLKTLDTPYLGERIREVKKPVLGFWGANDQFLPMTGANVLAERCDGSRTLLLANCGHWVMVEHTDVFNKMSVDFLNEG